MDYYADEQTFEYEEYRDFFDDEEEKEVDYDDDAEEKEEEEEKKTEGKSDLFDENDTFQEQYEQINENDFAELTFANLPFSMKDLYGGPMTSLQQIKMLYSNKNEKINFSELSDIDLFKVIATISVFTNKVHLLFPRIKVQNLIEDMLSKCDKIPDIKYKNPLACFLSFICIKRNGQIDETILSEVFKQSAAVKLNEYDIYRYCRMWQKIYGQKIDCE
jgi:hypothetical protein